MRMPRTYSRENRAAEYSSAALTKAHSHNDAQCIRGTRSDESSRNRRTKMLATSGRWSPELGRGLRLPGTEISGYAVRELDTHGGASFPRQLRRPRDFPRVFSQQTPFTGFLTRTPDCGKSLLLPRRSPARDWIGGFADGFGRGCGGFAAGRIGGGGRRYFLICERLLSWVGSLFVCKIVFEGY